MLIFVVLPFFSNKQVDHSLRSLLKYKITFLTQVGFCVLFQNGQTLLVWAAGHPTTASGVSCTTVILSGYSENHME